MAIATPAAVDAQTAAAESMSLLQSCDGGVATLTLNRPARRNALSDELLAALQTALDDIDNDASIRAVIVKANGPVFCAGHDLAEMRAKTGAQARLDLFQRCAKMMASITLSPKPVIAEVQGAAFAAGCQLVASCDLAIAAAGATFATPGAKIGLFCSTPMVALSRKIGAGAAMEMLLTGKPIDAKRALALGLINDIADDEDELTKRAGALAAQIAANSPQAIAVGKPAFYRQAEMPLAAAYDYTAEVMAQNLGLADAAEGIAAFLEKRKPVWKL